MKKILSLFLTIFTLGAAILPAQEELTDAEKDAILKEAMDYDIEIVASDKITRPFIVFNEGLAFAQTTRFQNQGENDRSNFRWEEYMIGAYCQAQTKNVRPLNFFARISLFYPFYHTFNGMEQTPVQVLLYGFDIYAGTTLQIENLKYVKFNLGLGPHFSYELTDAYHHAELGAMGLFGLELPIAWRWTILIDALGSIDYGNLGTNKTIAPYDFVWQYQVSLGVRYSIKATNEYSYIPSSQRILSSMGIYDAKQKKMLEKEAQKEYSQAKREKTKSKKQYEKERKQAEKADLAAKKKAQKEADAVEKYRKNLLKKADKVESKMSKDEIPDAPHHYNAEADEEIMEQAENIESGLEVEAKSE